MDSLETRRLLASIVYVDRSATGDGDGTSWSDAYASLQTALNEEPAGVEVRVARGTYKPSQSTGFILKDGMKLIGGYAEGGSAQSNPSANPTTLSGDIGTIGVHSDNATRLLYIVDGSIEVDGFTVRDAGTGGSNQPGAALYASNSSVRLTTT
jgi:hypothetical protein